MGGQQSTRRLTVVNDEASGVIKVGTIVTISIDLPTIAKCKTASKKGGYVAQADKTRQKQYAIQGLPDFTLK